MVTLFELQNFGCYLKFATTFQQHPSVEMDLSLKIEVRDQTIWNSRAAVRAGATGASAPAEIRQRVRRTRPQDLRIPFIS